jgi:hypothetical protein
LLQRERQRVTLFVSTVTSAPRAGGGAGQLEQRQAHAERVGGLTKPVATMALKLLKSGWFDFARREMLQGRNPGRNAWQRIFCDALMRGGIPRQALTLCFQEQMSLTPGSAKVRTSHAVSVFVTGRLVIESQGLLQLRRN